MMVPGRPMLPRKSLLIGLPPGACATAVEAILIGPDDFPGTYSPAHVRMPILLADQGERFEQSNCAESRALRKEGQPRLPHGPYPAEPCRITGLGSLRGYRYASVAICPCTYEPQSGRLIRYDSAEITVTYEHTPAESEDLTACQSPSPDGIADRRASELLVNYQDIENLYRPARRSPEAPLQAYDYVIITTSDLSGAVTASGFIAWKTSLGYSVRIMLIGDPEISGQPGGDLAEQIRNFLRAYYTVWGIEYVLLVGDYATVPMRYCYPDPTNHTNTAGTPGGTGGEVPTDCYYADLSDADATSWDSDGDGYYGEYGEDTPDFMPEVYVGRIPVNNTTRITYALDKTVTFEQDTGAWKHNALHAGAFWYFTDELGDTTPAMDGAKFLAYIESDIMSSWTVSRYSEQSGLEQSAYAWPALTHTTLTTDWRTGQYAVVNWGAHGWTDGVARKVWEFDDGDGIPEASEFSWPNMVGTTSSLDDDYPSIVCAASCLVGCPEPNAWDNMGIKMLTLPTWGPSVGVISSARSPYGSADWPPGGSESIIYEFNNMMIGGLEKVGQAFYNSKFYCTTSYGWDHYAEYINMYTFNLFGDPSLTREGIDIAGVVTEPEDSHIPQNAKIAAGPSPMLASAAIRYYVPSPVPADLAIFNVRGRRVRSFETRFDSEGWHEVVWDGCQDDGQPVASGIYWVCLRLPRETRTVSIMRLR